MSNINIKKRVTSWILAGTLFVTPVFVAGCGEKEEMPNDEPQIEENALEDMGDYTIVHDERVLGQIDINEKDDVIKDIKKNDGIPEELKQMVMEFVTFSEENDEEYINDNFKENIKDLEIVCQSTKDDIFYRVDYDYETNILYVDQSDPKYLYAGLYHLSTNENGVNTFAPQNVYNGLFGVKEYILQSQNAIQNGLYRVKASEAFGTTMSIEDGDGYVIAKLLSDLIGFDELNNLVCNGNIKDISEILIQNGYSEEEALIDFYYMDCYYRADIRQLYNTDNGRIKLEIVKAIYNKNIDIINNSNDINREEVYYNLRSIEQILSYSYYSNIINYDQKVMEEYASLVSALAAKSGLDVLDIMLEYELYKPEMFEESFSRPYFSTRFFKPIYKAIINKNIDGTVYYILYVVNYKSTDKFNAQESIEVEIKEEKSTGSYEHIGDMVLSKEFVPYEESPMIIIRYDSNGDLNFVGESNSLILKIEQQETFIGPKLVKTPL